MAYDRLRRCSMLFCVSVSACLICITNDTKETSGICQKELFKKRLEGLPLTKTEQEYYSRSVKKKVVALANAELHGLARKLLEK